MEPWWSLEIARTLECGIAKVGKVDPLRTPRRAESRYSRRCAASPSRWPPPLLLTLLLLLLASRAVAREDVNLDELDPDMDRDIFRFCVACPLPPKTSAEYCRRVCARKNVPPPENFGSYVDWAEMCAHLCKYKLGGPNCTCELHRVFSFSVHDLFNN